MSCCCPTDLSVKRVLSRGDSRNRCLELCGCGVSKNMLIVEHGTCLLRVLMSLDWHLAFVLRLVKRFLGKT